MHTKDLTFFQSIVIPYTRKIFQSIVILYKLRDTYHWDIQNWSNPLKNRRRSDCLANSSYNSHTIVSLFITTVLAGITVVRQPKLFHVSKICINRQLPIYETPVEMPSANKAALVTLTMEKMNNLCTVSSHKNGRYYSHLWNASRGPLLNLTYSCFPIQY